MPNPYIIYIFLLYSKKSLSSRQLPTASRPGPRPPAPALQDCKPGQKPCQAKSQARLGPAIFGLAWPGFRPQAGASTSLASVGSNPIVLLLSRFSSSDGGVGVRLKRNTPLRDVVLFRLVSLRKRGECR